MAAHRDCGSEAWRRRQMSSISLMGRERVLGTSRKDDKVLIPSGLVALGIGVV